MASALPRAISCRGHVTGRNFADAEVEVSLSEYDPEDMPEKAFHGSFRFSRLLKKS